MRRTALWITIAVWLPACGGSPATEAPFPPKDGRMTLHIESPAFTNGEKIPKIHTCDGKDVSPSLTWLGIPGHTRSLALICDDPDAPRNLDALGDL